jgi:hypothetical protein
VSVEWDGRDEEIEEPAALILAYKVLFYMAGVWYLIALYKLGAWLWRLL